MRVLITPKSFKNYKDETYPELISRGYEIIENTTGRTLSEDEIILLAGQDVQGIIVGVDILSARVLAGCQDLRAISKYGVGLDNIDLAAAARRNIKVMNAVGSNNISVAELTLALMFEAARHVSVMASNVKSGRWERALGVELTGKTLGLIGGGQIGKEVAKRARGLQMKVVIHDPYFKDASFLADHDIALCDSLVETLKQSDFLSLHLPLKPETRHLINADTLAMMKPTAILLNTSRGELVDEGALYVALKDKVISLAAQDVFSAEPPLPDEKLLTLDNFLLTPHAGAYTSEAILKMALYSTQNLITMLDS